jgi:DNA-binding CsgD family transcriptional regulator
MATLGGREHRLLDRESVLREIDALVREGTALGRRTIVRVSGPPGIGKTAVLRCVARGAGGRTRFVTAEAGCQTEPGFTTGLLIGRDARGSESKRLLRDALRAVVTESKMIVVDDVQWVDELSLRQLLEACGASTPATIVLGDRRLDAPEWPKHETIGLAPLRHSAALELVRRIYPAVPPAVAAEIADAADGVPFSLTLLASDAAARDVVDAGDAALSVDAVMARRLTRLSATARDAAGLLSLAEPPVTIRVLGHALGITVESAAGAASELADLVSVDGPLIAFRHGALADAVAASVSNAVESYARLLAAFEGESNSLAAIVRCALGCARHERAATAALELARELAREGSLGSALRYAEIAMANAPRPLPVEYAVEYSGILQLLARNDEAAAFLRQAVRAAIAAGDAPAAADLAASFFNSAVSLERFTELENLCSRIEALPGRSEAVLERVRAVRLASLAFAGRFEEYAQLAATGRHRWIDARTAAFVHAMRGEPGRATTEVDAYTAGLELRHARQQTADRILEVALSFFYRGTRALDELDALPTADARHPSERALRGLGRICEGRWDAARELLHPDDGDGDEPEQILAIRLLLAALAGDASEDARALHAIRSMIKQRRVRHAVDSARWYVVAKGDEAPADVRAFVRETLEVAPMPYAFAPSPLSTARLRDRFGAARCRSAIEGYPVFDTPWHRAHHDLALGIVEPSNERLRAARAAFEELSCSAFATIAGIALPMPRARDLTAARALGLLPAAQRTTTALTRRERAVAEQTARGASNQEVAEALSISVRTVETHLTKIYAKLGVGSRGAMIALMHEHDF